MKKYLGLLVMILVIAFPLNAKADTSITDPVPCTANSDGIYTCTVTATTDENNLSIDLIEYGGAEIISVEEYGWTLVNTPADNNGTWTVEVSSLDVTGEVSLFKFTYKPSGEENCHIGISIGSKSIEVVPDTKTENKQTGSSLPYVALGTIALLAGGAYLVTKDKSKMYRL